MSSLTPERTLVFSPALASTIGLEEAILLQLLSDMAALQGGEVCDLDSEFLARALPFWEPADVERIARSLRDKGILVLLSAPLTQSHRLRFSFETRAAPAPAQPAAPSADSQRRNSALRLSALWRPDEDVLQLLSLNHGIPREFALQQLEDFLLYWRSRGDAHHAWPSKFRSHVIRRWREREQSSAAQGLAEAMGSDWMPSEDAVQILERSGVSREFIEDAIPEFVLYWRERGEASSTWNSRFIAHIRRQWARYSSALQYEGEPRPIHPGWQPSEDVYDILRLANIDLEFARDQLAEFVLFWRDAGKPLRSWNSKFLQHVKYQWANRHQMGYSHAGSDTTSQRASAFQRLTDRSWAAGLVDGI